MTGGADACRSPGDALPMSQTARRQAPHAASSGSRGLQCEPTSLAVGILRFVVPVLSLALLAGCVTSGDFWDRSHGVAGEYEAAPRARRRSAPRPRRRYVQRTPQRRAPSAPPTMDAPPPNWTPRAETRRAAPPAPTPAPTPAPGNVSGPTSEDFRVLERVNQIRRQRGLRPLAWSQKLWIAARDHSLEQNRHGYMGHGSPDPRRDKLGQRIALAGYDGLGGPRSWPGATGTCPAWSAAGWTAARHRKILIDPDLTEVGFSRAGLYWTGNFGTPRRRVQAPRRVRTSAPARPLPRSVPAPAPRAAPRRAPAPPPASGFG